MKIFYKQNDLDNNFEDICNNNKTFISKSGSKAIIYKLKIENKTYVNKNYMKNDKSKKDFEIEKNKFFFVKKRSNNSILFKNFFIQYLLIAECDNNYIILMEKLTYDLNSNFLKKKIINDEKNNILFQILINIYDMNYSNKIYFNYIYINNCIRNIMILDNDNKKNIEYTFNENVKIIIPINKYKIKFIDYGNMNDTIKDKTIKYMKEYFEYLYKMNIISETILFTFFYFINCGLNEKNILLLIKQILKIIFKSNEFNKELNIIISNNSEKNKMVDYLFIYYLVEYLSTRPNFYDI